MQYPDVVDEWDTLNRIFDGVSLARFGDSEFGLIEGHNPCPSQRFDPYLKLELQSILRGAPGLMVAIPRHDPDNPFAEHWQPHLQRYTQHLHPDVTYYSAFVTRPDNAPWIQTPHFYDALERLWRQDPVTLVSNGKRSLTKEMLLSYGAVDVAWVPCPAVNAYDEIDAIERECAQLGRRTILCAGATATCLAARLTARNLHAIDLGHIGVCWRKDIDTARRDVRRPEINPMTGHVEPNP